jgi:indolepyruvate ferredoxin oxidoreductase, beta subunit
MSRVNFLFVGVGGQGILTASDITAEVGLTAGLDAKKSEIHGFSQRGGVVESHVRWGQRVYSPMGEKGTIDLLVGLEYLETGRFIDYLKPGGVVVTNTQHLIPMSVSNSDHTYPADSAIAATLKSRAGEVITIPALEIAQELGNTRLVNTIVLGALSTLLDVHPSHWLTIIESRVPPKYVELNRKAFWQGRQSLS